MSDSDSFRLLAALQFGGREYSRGQIQAWELTPTKRDDAGRIVAADVRVTYTDGTNATFSIGDVA